MTENSYLPLFGRILMSAIFILSGVSKILDWSGTADLMASKGIPVVPLFLSMAILVEIVGGASLHGLRHSTSELYIHHGATRDDLRRLFAHSSPTVTDRYVHDRGTNLEKIAQVIQLFPVVRDHETTTTG